MYLLIENKGVAPIEAFTLLGWSSTRDCGVKGAIGQFGSGTKHGLTTLLRKGVKFYFYCGLTQLEFSAEESTVDDGISETKAARIKCRLKGDVNRTIDCGWCLDFGSKDWTEISMALREFVSNALDRTKREQGNFTTGLRVAEVEDKRAKAGTTRVFVEMPDGDDPYADQEVRNFFEHIGERFLHFSDDPSQVNQTFLKKNSKTVGPRIFREGALMRTMVSDYESAFDYNFSAEDIDIDECRNSSEYVIRATIAQLVNKAEPETLVTLFNSMDGQETYESGLDEYYLSYSDTETQKTNWQTAWEEVAGNAVVAAEVNVQEIVDDFAREQGHKIKKIKSKAFAAVVGKMGVKTLTDAIGEHAASGKIEVAASAMVMASVDRLWCICARADLTENRPYPEVKCFKSATETYTDGYYSWDADRIVIRLGMEGTDLEGAVLEQLASYICRGSGSTQWLVKLAISQMKVGEQ